MPPILFKLGEALFGSMNRNGTGPFEPHLYQTTGPLTSLSGITRDSAGAILGNCRVQVFETATDRYITEVISDSTTGAYVVPVGIGTGPYYVVAYLTGAPDRAGTTVDTLTGS